MVDGVQGCGYCKRPYSSNRGASVSEVKLLHYESACVDVQRLSEAQSAASWSPCAERNFLWNACVAVEDRTRD